MRLYYSVLPIFFMLFLSVSYHQAQSNPLVVTLVNDTSDLTVCSGATIFKVEVSNPSPYNIDNGAVTINLPEGVSYVLGTMTDLSSSSLTDTNSIAGDLQNPVFNFPSIPMVTISGVDGFLSFTIEVQANCEVRGFIEGGGVLTNDVVINGTSDNLSSQNPNFSQIETSSLYNVEFPTLVITNVSPSSYTASIGDNFTRCITITNSGEGSLSEFYLFDKRNPSSVVINSVSYGPNGATQTGTADQTTLTNGDSLYFSGVDFTSIGDGDNLFEENEVIVICEDITINGCSGSQSEIVYWWECNGDTCQSGTESANVNFPGEAPNLLVTSSSDWDIHNMNGNCYGDTDPNSWSSSLTIENNSLSEAHNVQLEIYQGRTSFLNDYYWSSFNMSSFTIQINNGTPTPISQNDFDQTDTTRSRDCLPGNPVGRVFYTIPLINPGDIVTINWGRHTCCVSEYCNESGPVDRLLSWSYVGSYENRCGQSRSILRTMEPWHYNQSTITIDNSPGTLIGSSSGQPVGGTISLLTDAVRYGVPRDQPNSQSRYQIVLPPCLTYEPGSFKIINPIGSINYPDATVFNTGNDTISFYYDSTGGGNGQSHGNKFEVQFDVNLDCSSCNANSQGTQEVLFNAYYSPNLACDCEMPMGCEAIELELLCPPLCEGANLTNVIALRKNLGLSDNDDNGVPDLAPTVMDTSLVKRNRYMFGDTMSIKQEVFVQNSNSLAWNHILSSITFTGDDGSMVYDNSLVSIYDASQGSNGTWYICPITSVFPTIETLGVDTTKVTLDFVLSTLVTNGCLLSSFQFQNGDSIFINHEFIMSKSASPYTLHSGTISNTVNLSSVSYSPNMPQSDLFGCNEVSKPFLLVEYFWRTYGPPSVQYSTADCDAFQVQQTYYLSIGPPHSNYGGGNMFPFEYRNWGYPDVLSVTMPTGYRYVNGSAEFQHSATTGTNPYSPLTNYGYYPLDSINSSTNPVNKFSFNAGVYFRDSSNMPLGDDGFHGVFRAMFVPSCDVNTNVEENIGYEWNYSQVQQLVPGLTPVSSNSSHDKVTYFGPEILFQVDNPVKSTPNGFNNWVLDVVNTSAISDAPNFWIGANNTSIIIDSLLNNVTGLTQYPNSGGIFNLDTINATESENYILYTTLTQCAPDSIPLLYGWGCNSTPDSLSNYECIPDTMWLYSTPLFPQMSNDIEIVTNDTVPLCDVSTYELSVSNILLGDAFDVVPTVSLPNGMTIVPGSCQITFNGTTAPIVDPIYIGLTDYSWDIDAVYSPLDTGLVGVTNINLNNFQIQFDVTTNCDYTSGSQVEVQTYGESFCGDPDIALPEFSDELHILGVEPPYLSTVELNSQFIMPCGSTSIEVVVNIDTILNVFGQNGTLAGDLITLSFPEGVTYTMNSFAASNPPLFSPDPTTFMSQTIANEQQVSWELPQGIMPGESIVFNINVDADASLFECGTTLINGKATSSAQTLCISNSQNCTISVPTGELTDAIYVYKGDFILSDSTAVSVLNAPNGETVTVNFDILNIGGDIFAGFDTQVDFYSDVNGDSMFDPLTDVLITSDIITDSILGGVSNIYSYTGTINISGADACGFIVAIQPNTGTCVCEPVWFYISSDLQQPNQLLNMCYGEPIIVGTDSVINYSYNWELPGVGSFDSLNFAQPIYSYINNNSTSEQITLVRNINRGTCFAMDTTILTAFPAPSIECGVDVVAGLNNNCEFILTDYTGSATIEDACPSLTGVSLVQSPMPGTVLSGVAPIPIWIYIVSDELGTNIDSCSFELSLVDELPPSITQCVGEDIVKADANCTFLVPDYITSLGVEADNCDGNSYVVSQTPEVGTEITSTEGANEMVTIEVIDGSGNISTCQIVLTVSCADVTVYEYISPDDNGQNDVLLIPGIHRFPESHLKVFNRWGSEVYNVKNYQNDWSGTFEGKPLPSGTYYYVLKLTEDRDPITGYLELNRK